MEINIGKPECFLRSSSDYNVVRSIYIHQVPISKNRLTRGTFTITIKMERVRRLLLQNYFSFNFYLFFNVVKIYT